MSMWFISCHTVCAYNRYTQMYNKEFVGVYLHGLLVGVVHVRLALGYHLTGQLLEKGQNYEGCRWVVCSKCIIMHKCTLV